MRPVRISSSRNFVTLSPIACVTSSSGAKPPSSFGSLVLTTATTFFGSSCR